ncbi:MAG: CPBP family intramembrane metalloprotease [Geodermatophilaceae bacterium]|nr:CPBP family intramembrane metalloprotease [Geodermatophilaceae bacterium]
MSETTGPVPATGVPVPFPPPTPVFGWYIPAAPSQAPHGWPPGHQGGAFLGPPLGVPAYPPHPGAMAPYGPAWYPPVPWGPVRPPSFAKLPRAQPQPYFRLMRTVNHRWWRPILGLLAFLGTYVVSAVLVTLTFLAGGMELADLGQLDDLTDPATLALANASLIVAIPAVWVAWLAHTERIGWSSSVLGRIRWRLLWRYGLLGLAILATGILLSLAVSGGIGPSAGFDGRTFMLLVAIVVVSTPLQSAAEEYVFRGYLSQTIASWMPARALGAILAALITATLFSLAHAPGDFFTFLDRFAFGLTASAVVWLTGGLEAAIAFHAANNIIVFLVVGALGGATSSDIQAGPGTAALVVGLDILAMALYVWVVARTRGRWHPETLSRALDPAAAVVPSQPPPPGWGGGPPGWGPPQPGTLAQPLPSPAPAALAPYPPSS